jgi:hypothetical protein
MKTQSLLKKVVLSVFAVCFVSSGAIYAQAEQTKKILENFTSITLNGTFDVTLVQGTENSVSVKEGNIEELVSAEVKDNNLVLKNAKKSASDVTITFINLNKLELSASGDVTAPDTIRSDKFEILLNGAVSDLKLNVNVKELSTVISGAGDVTLKGTADSHFIQIKGAGDVKAYDLATNTTNVEILGAGDAKVNAKQELKGEINGAGNITYLQEPASKNITINGIGSYSMKGADEFDSDTLKFKVGKRKFMVMGDEDEKGDKKGKAKLPAINWAGIGLGVNGYLNADNKTDVPAGYDFLDLDYRKSINVQVNFWEQRIPIVKKHINLVTGMGFDFSNYRFEKNYRLNTDASYASATFDSVYDFKKVKLVTTYLQVPLLLQFNTNASDKNKTFHFSAGVVGGLRIGSHTKYVYDEGNAEVKPKTRDDYNLSPFRYSAMARIGYGKIDLYASYALNSLFKKNEGPQLYPFNVGITLVGF